MWRKYANRREAGRILAGQLQQYVDKAGVLVLALPRGGAPVGFEVARALHVPMDVFLVRKLGVPGHEELAMGAIATGGVRVVNPDVVQDLDISDATIERVAQEEGRELERRERMYRGDQPPVNVQSKTVIVVDDGLATGASMSAAAEAIRQLEPARLVVATPTGAVSTVERIRSQEGVDEVVCPHTPDPFWAVGASYEEFAPTSDEEVIDLLRQAQLWAPRPAEELTYGTRGEPGAGVSDQVRIATDGVVIDGDLDIPAGARAIVLFAHGSGSSRHSPRNRHVAGRLRDAGLGTLLIDLLTLEEEAVDEYTRALRFDISMLAVRLVGVIDWLERDRRTRGLRVGLFGASTGAAAALVAAAMRSHRVGAVVSRGGRPDLAGDALPKVQAPTLLIVGGEDTTVIELNQRAEARMQAIHEMKIVPGATHLFEEPGTLDQAAEHAANWFARFLLQELRAAG